MMTPKLCRPESAIGLNVDPSNAKTQENEHRRKEAAEKASGNTAAVPSPKFASTSITGHPPASAKLSTVAATTKMTPVPAATALTANSTVELV